MSAILLFDGECNFCDRSVQFIIKRDPSGYFKFASLQSPSGLKLVEQASIPRHIDSIVLIEQNRVYYKSTAALHICKHLKGLWKVFSVLLLVPKPIRDSFYDYIARNRYKWFGKKDHCQLPSPELRNRFL